MNRAPEERARLKALVRGERVIARPAPPPTRLDYGAYELPIMRALAERGGRAARREIVFAVGQGMAGQHTSHDLERLPSGEPRWKTRVGKARARLIERGWLATDSPRGQMELTKLGQAKVRRDGKAGRISSRPDVAEAELAAAA